MAYLKMILFDHVYSQLCFVGDETDPSYQEEVYSCLEGCVRYSAKSLLTVFFSVLWGGFQIGQAAPYLGNII